MVCVKCKSKNIRVGVSIFIYIDPEDVHKLTKKLFRKKSTELWYAKWNKAQIVCNDCGYIHIGC